MLNRSIVVASILLVGSLPAGCASVKAIRGGDGIPFYPSKPYLVVTKNLPTLPSTATVKKKTVTTTKPDGTTVVEEDTEQPATPTSDTSYSFQIVYLPDLANRYGIKIDSGLGSATANVTLEQGWRLASINATADSKAAENLTALGSMVGAVASSVFPKPLSTDDSASLEIYEMNADKNGNISFKQVFSGTPFQVGK